MIKIPSIESKSHKYIVSLIATDHIEVIVNGNPTEVDFTVGNNNVAIVKFEYSENKEET